MKLTDLEDKNEDSEKLDEPSLSVVPHPNDIKWDGPNDKIRELGRRRVLSRAVLLQYMHGGSTYHLQRFHRLGRLLSIKTKQEDGEVVARGDRNCSEGGQCL